MSRAHGLSFVPAAASPSAQAFSLQYITLMLIIITFFVGAILRPALDTPSVALPVPSAIPVVQSAPVPPRDVFVLAQFFDGNAGTMSSELATGLASVLTHHDRDAEVEILASNASPREFDIALDRAEALYLFLVRQGVPATAVRVSVVPEFEERTDFAPTAVRVVLRQTQGGE